MTILTKDGQSLLFLHIPKCGGTSVVDTFLAYGFEAELQIRGKPIQGYLTASLQHQTCASLKVLIRFEAISDVFAVVRNPYDRLQSEYNWSHRFTPCHERPNYSDWVLQSLEKAVADPSYLDNHIRPMIDFFDAECPSRIFRLEDGLGLVMEHYLQSVKSNLEIRLVHEKNAANLGFKCPDLVLNDVALQAVNNYYYHDFCAFNYSLLQPGSHGKSFAYEGLPDAKAPIDCTTILNWQVDTYRLTGLKLNASLSYLRGALDAVAIPVDQNERSGSTAAVKVWPNSIALFDELAIKLSVAKYELHKILSPKEEGPDYGDIKALMMLVSGFRTRLCHRLECVGSPCPLSDDG